MKTKVDNIMVSISMLKFMASELVKAGFQNILRTKEQQEAMNRLSEQRTPGKDVYRLGRTDAAGNKVADGGNLLFGKDGQKIVSPTKLAADLKKQGYSLIVAETFEKQGDEEHIRLRLTWSLNATSEICLTDKQKSVARRYFDGVYWKMFGFFNQEALSLEGDASPVKGSIVTLNFSGVMNQANVQLRRNEIRDLQMIAEGHFRCIFRPPATGQSVDWRPGDDMIGATTEEVVKAAFDREPPTFCPSHPTPRSNPS